MKYVKKNKKTHFEYLLEEVNKQVLNILFTKREVIERVMFTQDLLHVNSVYGVIKKTSLFRTLDRYFTDLTKAGWLIQQGRPGIYIIREKLPMGLTPTKIRRI